MLSHHFKCSDKLTQSSESLLINESFKTMLPMDLQDGRSDNIGTSGLRFVRTRRSTRKRMHLSTVNAGNGQDSLEEQNHAKHAQEVISKTRQKKQKNSIPFVSIFTIPFHKFF
jgi:hypothetical protein